MNWIMENDFLLILNVEKLITKEFMVGALYYQGTQIDSFIKEFRGYGQVLDLAEYIKGYYGSNYLEIHTSDPEIFRLTLEQPGIYGHIKHKSDTTVTESIVKTNKLVLMELYDISSTDQTGGGEAREKKQEEVLGTKEIVRNWLVGLWKRFTEFLKNLRGGRKESEI